MIWLNPAAWIALVAVAAPILIHIFVQRKGRPLPFPTLRFLQPTRLAAIRRHMLEDLPLLAVRAAILAAAVAAFAGPLLVRRQAWNARVTRAVVIDRDVSRFSSLVSRATSNSLSRGRSGGAGEQRATSDEQRGTSSEQRATADQAGAVFATQTIEARSIADGIRRARTWLDSAPPARREIVIVSPLAIGSVTAATIASIPPEIGIRFDRAGELPKERTVDGGEILGADTQVGPYASTERVGADLRVRPRLFRRDVTLAADGTSMSEEASGQRPFPIEVIAPPSARPAIDRAIAAVLTRHVWAPPADRLATLVIGGGGAVAPPQAETITQPWMADAVARIAIDDDLAASASRTRATIDASRFGGPPWVVAVRAANGQPMAAAAASGGRLLVVSAADASDFITPLLMRAIVNTMADPPDLRAAEVVPIPDDQLRAWTRPPGPIARLRNDAVGSDDRRWLWALVLALIGAESWLRRHRQTSDFQLQTSAESQHAA